MNEYPRMLYAGDGRTMTVMSEEAELNATGFSRDPSDIHRTAPQSVAPPVQMSGQSELAMAVAVTVVELMAERFDLKPKQAPVAPLVPQSTKKV